jgi:hypothetical protein
MALLTSKVIKWHPLEGAVMVTSCWNQRGIDCSLGISDWVDEEQLVVGAAAAIKDENKDELLLAGRNAATDTAGTAINR